MSFQPIVPTSGYGGWKFLTRTLERQQQAYDTSPVIQRDTEYFSENIASVKNAGDLVEDPRLLRVALGAFGLGADAGNKFFIKKVLEDGTLDPASLSNRLSDKRYLEFSKAFGFGDSAIPNTSLHDFADRITRAFKDQRFEVAVGQVDENMRLVLGTLRELTDLSARQISGDAKWFTIMGKAPTRKVFEVALGLPSSFATLNIDRQLDVFKEKAKALFGDGGIDQFSNPENTEKLIRNFLFRSELSSSATLTNGANTALTLLQSAARSFPKFGQ